MSSPRERIIDFTKQNFPTYKAISKAIHDKPEVSDFEFFASETLSEQLKKEGFEIELPAAGHRTGFAARYKSKKPGPVIVFLAEFDALAGLGHGCGHNIFGATSSLAGAALKSVIDETGGEVRVYGTPGEEGGQNGSAKASFVDKGYFKDVDAALCEHPGGSVDNGLTVPGGLACIPVDIEFWGKAAHAAGDPWDGINAEDALILVYNAISELRQSVRPDTRIHGVILEAGKAPNVIPDYAHAKYFLRTSSMKTLKELYAKVDNIVKGAELATGAKGRLQPYQNWVDVMVATPALDAVFEKELNEAGYKAVHADGKAGGGSSDVGNVSQVVPTIQPHISITDHQIAGHSIDFVNAAGSDYGLATIALGARVLALTALDLIENPALLAKIKKEHAYNVEHQQEDYYHYESWKDVVAE